MRSLAKLISVNGPDLVLFVGEALVGNEAIDQLVKFNEFFFFKSWNIFNKQVKFNAALADHSSQENPHTIDGIVLTKFDTIDDKVILALKMVAKIQIHAQIQIQIQKFQVGSSISMTYISGQPIVFVGTGQTYTDLKSLNAKVNFI